VTERVIGCAFRIANVLRHGFIETVSEMPSPTRYESPGSAQCSSERSRSFYDYVIIEDQVIVELKVVAALSDVHLPQRRNVLRPTAKPPNPEPRSLPIYVGPSSKWAASPPKPYGDNNPLHSLLSNVIRLQ
jgi:hypothetical protein